MQKASPGAVRLQESAEFRDADPPVGLPARVPILAPPPSDQWGFAKLLKLWVSVLTGEIRNRESGTCLRGCGEGWQ